MFSDLRFRLRALFRRSAMERELDEELRFHLEHEIEQQVAAGVPRAEAERRARVAFGGIERIKDDARDARGISALEILGQDLRYAARGLRSTPGFTAAVVITLALGIGANVAMFGIVDRLLFRAPNYLRAPERVHRVYVAWTDNNAERVERTIEYLRFEDLTRWTTAFDRTAVAAYRSLAVGTGDAARELPVAVVSATFFDLFDARPVIGRFFAPDEDRTPVGADVAVLGYGLWQSRYAGSRDVLGRRIQIGDLTCTVIGVAPDGFVGITDDAAPVAFVPVTTFAHGRSHDYNQNYGWSWLEMFARRRSGVSVQAASADLTSAYRRSWEAERARDRLPPLDVARPRSFAGNVLLARGPEASADSRIVAWVMGVAVIVLLVACANVANLLLARALKRRREIALRLALGVSRARLLQQLATESALLAAIGGIAGLLVAQWGGRTLRALFLRVEDRDVVVTDGRTLLFVAVVTLGVAVMTGLAPAMHSFRGDLADALKAGAREGTYRRSRTRTALLLFQGALSVVLLIGAGLFVRSLGNVRALRLGYDVDPVVYVDGNPRGEQLSHAQVNALNERLVEVALQTPGVRSASLTISVPFWSNEGRGTPTVPGRDSLRRLGRFTLQAGSPRYFETVGTRIVSGRGITDADRAGTPRVLVISQSMADAIWPGEDAIGKQIRIGSDTTPFSTVVGIAEDMRARQIAGDREFWYYMPIAQYISFYGSAAPALFVRVDGRAEDYVETLRRRLQREMPGASYVQAVPLRSFVAILSTRTDRR